MSGRSTTVSISFGIALVAGRKRVPSPATGNTALRTRAAIQVLFKVKLNQARAGQTPKLEVPQPLSDNTRRIANGRMVRLFNGRSGHGWSWLHRQPYGARAARRWRGRCRSRQSVDRVPLGGTGRGEVRRGRYRR